MKPSDVTVDFGRPDPDSPPRSSSDFEEVPYPSNHWASSHQQEAHEELPLHYMNEDKARRRVVRGPDGAGSYYGSQEKDQLLQQYDDYEGKDVYNKARPPVSTRQSSGRLRHAPPPPPTSIVSLSSLCCATRSNIQPSILRQ